MFRTFYNLCNIPIHIFLIFKRSNPYQIIIYRVETVRIKNNLFYIFNLVCVLFLNKNSFENKI